MFDFEQNILMNKTLIEDRMYMKTGIEGKDLQRAVIKYGIHEAAIKKAKQLETEYYNRIMD